jgi:hypothetical protein
LCTDKEKRGLRVKFPHATRPKSFIEYFLGALASFLVLQLLWLDPNTVQIPPVQIILEMGLIPRLFIPILSFPLIPKVVICSLVTLCMVYSAPWCPNCQQAFQFETEKDAFYCHHYKFSFRLRGQRRSPNLSGRA